MRYHLESEQVLECGFRTGKALICTNPKWTIGIGYTFDAAAPLAGTYLCVAPLFHSAPNGGSKRKWEVLALPHGTPVATCTSNQLVAVPAAVVQHTTVSAAPLALTDADRTAMCNAVKQHVATIAAARSARTQHDAKNDADAAAVAAAMAGDAALKPTRPRRSSRHKPAAQQPQPHGADADEDGDGDDVVETGNKPKRQRRSRAKSKSRKRRAHVDAGAERLPTTTTTTATEAVQRL